MALVGEKHEDLAASRVGRYQSKNKELKKHLLLRLFQTVSGRARVNSVYSTERKQAKKAVEKEINENFLSKET